MIVADYIAERFRGLGIRHVFGVGGANIEDVFVAVQRRRPELRAVLGKHEHAAGTAADGYARITGRLAVVLATSGGGAMNLVHSMAEARASHVPLLAIVGEPPTELQGRGAFQDTSGQGGSVDAVAVFRAVATWAGRVAHADELPHLLEHAIDAARSGPGPAVLLIATDHQRAEVGPLRFAKIEESVRVPADAAAVASAAELLAPAGSKLVVIAGDEVPRAGAQAALARFVERTGALVAVAPDARDAFANDDSCFLGVAGAMGHRAVARAVAAAGACVLVGTRLPLLTRQGLEPLLRAKPLVSVGRAAPFVASGASLHLRGDLANTLVVLGSALASREPSEPPRTSPGGAATSPAGASSFGARLPDRPLDSASAFEEIERAMPPGVTVVIDAGNTGASAAHYLRAPAGGRWLLAMGMAGMGYAFGAAVGAAFASRRRSVVIAGDGAFFMHGLDVHTAVEHDLPVTYVVFNNDAHGMCLVRERLLLREDAGYNAFRRSHIGAGAAAMFPGLLARDCATLHELVGALRESFAHAGPSLIAVELRDVEVPPFAAFEDATGARPPTVTRGEGR